MVPPRGEKGLLISNNNQEVSNNCSSSSSNRNRIRQCMMVPQQMLYCLLRKSFISLRRHFLKMLLQQLSRADYTLKHIGACDWSHVPNFQYGIIC